MSKIYRRFLFWGFLLLFLIAAPTAILYSYGYRFDRYRGIFVHSGSVTVKSTPTQVDIFLNGKIQKKKNLNIINNSLTINGLRPGTYSLRLSADGRWDWEKTIAVHSGISTEFWNVFLAQKNPKVEKLETGRVERYFLSPFGKKVVFTQVTDNQFELWTVDIEEGKPAQIFSGDNLIFPEDDLENIEWNFEEELIIVPLIKDGRKDYLILEIDNPDGAFFASEILPSKKLNRARWSPKEKEVFYLLAEQESGNRNELYKVDLRSRLAKVILDDVVTYDLSSNSIYILRGNKIIYETDLNGEGNIQTVFSPLTLSEIDTNSRLIVYDADRQALITQDGELFIHNRGKEDTIKKLSDNVNSVQFSDDGKKLLFWNDYEISVVFLREWKVQPQREENEVQQIIRLSSPIENALWYEDYEHIFFATQGIIKLIELDPRDGRLCFDVYRTNLDHFRGSYDLLNGVYYFIDEVNGQRNLFYLKIPEEKGFFGR